MATDELIHRINWSPAALSKEPLSIAHAVFVLTDKESEILSAYQTQLAHERITTVVIDDAIQIDSLITPKSHPRLSIHQTQVQSSNMSSFLSFLCAQTIGRVLPINVDRLPIVGRRLPALDGVEQDDAGSCPVNPPLSTMERTVFSPGGCLVYGYPSTGGVLIKSANLVDLLFLSLPRFQAVQRASSVDEEDRFCKLLRRTGATWWLSREDELEAVLGVRKMTEEEKKVLVFGWPADGVGVWVLRFANAKEMPRDFMRISFAMNMEERIQIMREYGATFVEDVSQVEELRETL
ncbi:hypothetical protein AnigIFM60653_002404 [Aspergillus niger]|nr:hypothetical protein AnigIFM50267_002451 [Aspergillus niger]GLA02834.1 hypothetical protein AnigIFM60653_002404 [Aspergillus niger]GLA17581.1 hypothetical protein AnigIFM62618_004724 [Aspergillus niger]